MHVTLTVMLPVHKLDTGGHVASPACSVYGCSGWATNLCMFHAWLFQCVHVKYRIAGNFRGTKLSRFW